ncbi:MAG: pyruvate dehydrogenase (acetyl-transferring) E1 component subunit alpha [Gemmatales bacterium]|nr:pyruvate dehydrogenase (acetyl-transferring) E1 component subunit alpha [Gemmatales bacterium]MDW7995866.1 pyruvate dehydrogenase (acetyl-transferring) E1 component subunit alpha [Gemmatales bacterium]
MPRQPLVQFQVDYLQILDENGRVDAALEPSLPQATLLQIHRCMTLARLLDRRMHILQQQGRMGTFPSCYGQEAAGLGCVLALRPDDWLVPAYRETSALFYRGLPMKNVLLFWMGLEEGNYWSPQLRVLSIPILIGSQTLHAVGIALACQIRGSDEVTMVFFGDGATSEGDFHEACNLAGVYQAPVVFVCINNQYAISVPRCLQSHSETLAQKAIAYGFPGIVVDGNDVLACYVAAQEAVQRARRGQGPTLIECLTYRLGPHTTADDPRRYRSEQERLQWEAKDPLKRWRIYLEQRGLWSESQQLELERELLAEIDAAVRQAEYDLAHADPLEMFDFVYAELPPDLAAQRREAAEHVAQTDTVSASARR